MAYADYTFYTDEYKGAMSSADFEKYSVSASREIDIATFDRSKDAPDNMVDKLKLATCSLADLLYKNDKINAETNNGTVSSVSNDGYSQSFTDNKQVKEKFESGKNNIFKSYLTFPVNLMYRGL
jgi:hypothetical protein